MIPHLSHCETLSIHLISTGIWRRGSMNLVSAQDFEELGSSLLQICSKLAAGNKRVSLEEGRRFERMSLSLRLDQPAAGHLSILVCLGYSCHCWQVVARVGLSGQRRDGPGQSSDGFGLVGLEALPG